MRSLVARTGAIVAALAFFLPGCSSPPTDETPSGALRLFLDAIWTSEAQDGDDDRETLEAAFALLDEASRDRLTRDARMAAALGGREREPWEMLAAGASRMVLRPRSHGGMREVIAEDGESATVTVSGEDGSTGDVRLAREADGWRVVLDMPSD